jgi:RNA polymerase sigma-70 factor (ECF subfamily)
MDPQSDADLVQRYLRGEPQAAALVDGWIAAAAWPFRRRLSVDWDDLLQEIRLEVVRLLQAGVFRGESKLKTYLWQVSCHTCLDAVRRQRRRTFVGLEAVASLATTGASPFEALARQEGTERALRTLATLSGECRELWKKLLRGVSYREIGKELGVSEGTLRVRAHRCRKTAVDAYRAAIDAAPPAEDESAVS